MSAAAGGGIWKGLAPARRLLLLALGFSVVGYILFLGANYRAWVGSSVADLAPLGIYLVTVAVVLAGLHLFQYRGDPVLPGLALLLAGFGVLAQSRMGSITLDEGFNLRLMAFPMGAAGMLLLGLLLGRERYKLLARLGPLCGLLVLAGVAAMLLLGRRYRGGLYGPGLLTPTELIKVPMVIFLAAYMQQRLKQLREGGFAGVGLPIRALAPLGLYWILLAGLLVLQRDLGMFVILSAVMITMLFLATGRLSYLLYALVGTGVFGAVAFRYLGHGQQRLQAWLDPFQDPTGSGWQILQGLSGMYAGGLFGAGFGQGQPERIPIAASDFIYAAIGEELGFIGCLLLVALYLALFRRGYRCAAATPDPFGRLLQAGLISILTVQTFLNLAGVTKLMPLTGVPLPFVSHGGSSLLTAFAAVGLMMAASPPLPREKKKPRAKSGKKTKKTKKSRKKKTRKKKTRR